LTDARREGRQAKNGRKKAFIKYHEIEISDEQKIQVIDTKMSVIVYCAFNLNLIKNHTEVIKIKDGREYHLGRSCRKLITQLDSYVFLRPNDSWIQVISDWAEFFETFHVIFILCYPPCTFQPSSRKPQPILYRRRYRLLISRWAKLKGKKKGKGQVRLYVRLYRTAVRGCAPRLTRRVEAISNY